MTKARDMTLRDFFAGLALHAIVSRMDEEERSLTDWSFDELGQRIDAADAMLAKRDEP